ncbi:FAD-dependent monooxygenase [Streptomyces violens]|uniref:FAD-dependent monooxygenase n=1 Tax=Streptomyces violens TaxID=66377 RepID=UPI0004C221B0|nr:FAD-dependent monooxygenase [Streptomyces violens]
MRSRTVLVSGAGIAGLATAYWLRHQGYEPTVVERAPGLRPGGQAIDVRGVALDVLDRMGVLPDARRLRTRMRGMSMLDATGEEVWRSTEQTFSSGRLDSDDIELLRDDLTALLYEQARDGIEYLFGDSIATLQEAADGVRVGFERAPARSFDLVVGADGLHSTVRRLAFGAEPEFLRHLGAYVGVFSTGNFLELDDWQVWLQDGGASYVVYPARGNSELRATLGFSSEPFTYDHRDTEHQKALLQERLGHLGWETPKLLAAMREAPDFYFDAMAQIHLDRWTAGRVALVGDAGYCPSPLSGQGTSLALVGAYVLAAELGRTPEDHRAAFGRYDARLRPFVARNQALATENPSGPAPEESIEAAKNGLALDG